MKQDHETSPCAICQKHFPTRNMFPLAIFRNRFLKVIQEQYPSVSEEGLICLNDFEGCCNVYRRWVVENHDGQPSQLTEQLLHSMEEKQLISDNINDAFIEKLSFSDRVSDQVSDFGGSWTFIISFSVFMLIWIIINSYGILNNTFDPYPYIFLNLILSCVAALQAPIIMMSQKRQEKKDRLRSEQDYLVNLKAELEIRHIKNMLEQLTKLTWHGPHK